MCMRQTVGSQGLIFPSTVYCTCWYTINGKYSAGIKLETAVRILTNRVEVKRRVTQFGGLSDLKNGYRDM